MCAMSQVFSVVWWQQPAREVASGSGDKHSREDFFSWQGRQWWWSRQRLLREFWDIYLWIYTKRYCPPWMGKWEYCLNWWQVWSNSIGSVFTNEQISILNWVSKPRRGNNLSTDQVCPVLMLPMVGQMMQINGKSKIKPMMLGDQAEGVQIDDSWQQRDLFLKFK